MDQPRSGICFLKARDTFTAYGKILALRQITPRGDARRRDLRMYECRRYQIYPGLVNRLSPLFGRGVWLEGAQQSLTHYM